MAETGAPPHLPLTPPDSTITANFPDGSLSPGKECFQSSSPLSSSAYQTNESRNSHSDMITDSSDSVIRLWLGNMFGSAKDTEYKVNADVPKYYKEFGYRAFSQLIASEQTFFMVRRFGALNARVALCLQDKITKLSDKLDEYDEDNADPYVGDVNNGTFREEHDTRRTELIEGELLDSLTKYSAFNFTDTRRKC
jgi:hypothetical protein